MDWIKSSSSNSTGNCVEAALSVNGDRVFIRDSNLPNLLIACSVADWNAFLDGVKAGDFDRVAEGEPAKALPR